MSDIKWNNLSFTDKMKIHLNDLLNEIGIDIHFTVPNDDLLYYNGKEEYREKEYIPLNDLSPNQQRELDFDPDNLD